MTTPLLTIAIPTYNRGAILRRTLPHIARQVHNFAGDVEIIVGNNGSTDDSENVIQGQAVRSIRNPTNIGSFPNILELAAHARAPWVWTLGDDDYLVPGALAELLETLRSVRRERLVFVNHGWAKVSRITESIDSKLPIIPDDLKQWDVCGIHNLMLGTDIFSVPSTFAAGSFNSIFGWLQRREDLCELGAALRTPSALDGSSADVQTVFPHSIVGLELARRGPALLHGSVSIIQGVGDWEWKRHLYRTTILGLNDLLSPLGSEIPHQAWESWARYSGVRLARMMANPEANVGLEDVLDRALQSLQRYDTFFDDFDLECKNLMFAPAEVSPNAFLRVRAAGVQRRLQ